MFRNMKLGVKLMTIGCGLTLIPLLIIFVMGLFQFGRMTEVSKTESMKQAYTDLDHMAESVYAIAESQQEVLERQMVYALNVARDFVDRKGGFRFSKEIIYWDAVNQYTQSPSQIKLPRMLFDNNWLGQIREQGTEVPIVDEVQKLTGVTCTIFQRMNSAGDMLRVATNVLKKDGTRAIGTYIPHINPDGKPNPVISTVVTGQTYNGRAYVVNKWYITAYEPIYDANKNIVGVLYVGIPQESAASLRKAIMNVKVGTTGYVYVLDSEGTYVISKNGGRDGEVLWESKDGKGNFFIQEIVNKALVLKPNEVAEHWYPWQNPGDPVARMKVARIKYFKPWDWVIGVGSYEEEFLASTNYIADVGKQNNWISAIVAAVSLVAAMLTWLFISRGIAGPIVRIAGQVRKVALERDFTIDVPVESKDEVGQMAGEFNNMLVQLRDAFKRVKDSAGHVTVKAADVAQRATANQDRAETEVEQTKKSADIITEMGSTAGEVAQASEGQKEAAEASNATVITLVNAMAEVSTSATEQNKEADEATERVIEMGVTGGKVAETARSQGEMVVKAAVAVNDITKAVEEMNIAVSQAKEHGKTVLESAKEGSHSVASTVDGMRAIAESSEQISEIIGVITEIAEQTNLLALNAAIEAARAGAHGKGFAVVADEVGKLAQRSSEAAKEITQLIKDSTTRVAEGTKLSDESQQSLAKIDEGGKVNMEAIEEIAKSADVLAAGTGEVQTLMEELNTLAQEIGEMAGEQGPRRQAAEKALAQLVDQSKAITDLVEDANKGAATIVEQMEGIVDRTAGMMEMTGLQAQRSKNVMEIAKSSAESARNTVEGAGQVVGITDELQEQSQTLIEQVRQFKIETDGSRAATEADE